MKQFPLTAVAASVLMAACAQQPVAQQPGVAPSNGVAAEQPALKAAPQPPAQQPKVVVTRPAPRKPPLPAVGLTQQIMFKVMLAEIAVQRGQPHIAVPAYLDLARETRDPRLAQRATEVAWNARIIPAALEAAGLWLQTDPESPQARQVLAALLVNQPSLVEARPHLEKWLAIDSANVGQAFLQLSGLLGRHKDKQAVFQLMQSLAKPYPSVPEARLSVAQAAWNAGDGTSALEESRAALKLRPDWELAALFQAQVIQRRSNSEAIDFLGSYLQAQPGARDARLNYARLLVTEKRYDEARKQFEALVQAFPENVEVTMAVALLAMQATDFDAAEKQFRRVLELRQKDNDLVRYYLGQLGEERKRFDEALEWYAGVGPGDQYINAQIRYAGVLAKQGKLADARGHLQNATASNNQQRVQLTQAEAQLLRDAQNYDEAFAVLRLALEKLPNYPDLLYDYAMAAEKIGRMEEMEGNLRKLIEIRPDHAHAYNALGYSLADRSQRIDEARALIEKAISLAPDDPFILDSLGWVQFRQGQIKEALDTLQRAYLLRADPEIAAHYGEVLYVDGQQDQAHKVWSDALKENPRNDVLQGTVKRLAPRILPAAR
jgi:tetratricopeptide (TPR) repeat protein